MRLLQRIAIGYLGLLWLIAVLTASANEELVSADKSLDGIWKGQFDINGRGPYDFLVVNSVGQSYAYSLAATTVCVGGVSASNTQFRADYQLFAMDGGRFDSATIEGEVSFSRGIRSRFLTHRAQDQGELQLNYQVPDKESIPVKGLKGGWGFIDRDGMSITATFESDGNFTAVDSQGCEYQGYVTAMNNLINVYSLQLKIKLCASVDGDYRGVGFLDGDSATRDHFKVIVTNERYGMYYDFRKGLASEYVPLFKDRLRL